MDPKIVRRPPVIKQRSWSDGELSALGFKRYERKRQLVMARTLPEGEAPMTFVWPLETLIVEVGYVICYDPGPTARPTLNDYAHWPVRADIFRRTFRAWDEAQWTPTSAERHLIRCGCAPHFKVEGIWARLLVEDTLVQSIESSEPVLVPAGMWLAIGALGEPWYIDDQTMRTRYSEGATL